jgi:hypothetical protein
MRPLFSFQCWSSGLTVGLHEVGRRRWLVCFALVREEEEDGRLGREGELGRPRGRGPVGRGGQRPAGKEKKGYGWAETPDGPAGRWVVGPNVRKIVF